VTIRSHGAAITIRLRRLLANDGAPGGAERVEVQRRLGTRLDHFCRPITRPHKIAHLDSSYPERLLCAQFLAAEQHKVPITDNCKRTLFAIEMREFIKSVTHI